MQRIVYEHRCGILVTHKCNASCRHCLFACSPERSENYMSPAIAERICNQLLKKNIKTVHIGGGEPFLNFNGLLKVVETINNIGIDIEYIETNGFWAADEKQALIYLSALEKVGTDTLFISFDPFHAEYIPIGVPIRLAQMCEDMGINYILYQEKFRTTLDCVNKDKTHSRKDLEELISPIYLLEAAQSYNLNFNGRAINIYEEYEPFKPLSEIIEMSKPCKHLLRTDFFHVDVNENYIPNCPGIGVPISEVISGVTQKSYPIFETLINNGVTGLLIYAEQFGFAVGEKYASPCMLCFHIRNWLSKTGKCSELDAEFYRAALTTN